MKIIEIQGYVVLMNHNAIHLDQLKFKRSDGYIISITIRIAYNLPTDVL